MNDDCLDFIKRILTTATHPLDGEIVCDQMGGVWTPREVRRAMWTGVDRGALVITRDWKWALPEQVEKYHASLGPVVMVPHAWDGHP